jgi:hypothetical protein
MRQPGPDAKRFISTVMLWSKEVGKMTARKSLRGQMKLRVFLLGAALVASGNAIGATSFSEAAQRLDGEWRGTDFVLRVDAKRAQASVDIARPFEWERFLIKDVTEGEITFSVGAELFEAKLAEGTLTLTGTSFRGPRVLLREATLRGTTSE